MLEFVLLSITTSLLHERIRINTNQFQFSVFPYIISSIATPYLLFSRRGELTGLFNTGGYVPIMMVLAYVSKFYLAKMNSKYIYTSGYSYYSAQIVLRLVEILSLLVLNQISQIR